MFNSSEKEIQKQVQDKVKKAEAKGMPVRIACSVVFVPADIEKMQIGILVNPVFTDFKKRMNATSTMVVSMDENNIMIFENPPCEDKEVNVIANDALLNHSAVGDIGIEIRGDVIFMGADAYADMFSTDEEMIDWMAETKAKEIVSMIEKGADPDDLIAAALGFLQD